MSREQSWIGTHRCLANKSKRGLSPESPSALLNRDCSKSHHEALQRGAHIEIVYKGWKTVNIILSERVLTTTHRYRDTVTSPRLLPCRKITTRPTALHCPAAFNVVRVSTSRNLASVTASSLLSTAPDHPLAASGAYLHSTHSGLLRRWTHSAGLPCSPRTMVLPGIPRWPCIASVQGRLLGNI